MSDFENMTEEELKKKYEEVKEEVKAGITLKGETALREAQEAGENLEKEKKLSQKAVADALNVAENDIAEAIDTLGKEGKISSKEVETLHKGLNKLGVQTEKLEENVVEASDIFVNNLNNLAAEVPKSLKGKLKAVLQKFQKAKTKAEASEKKQESLMKRLRNKLKEFKDSRKENKRLKSEGYNKKIETFVNNIKEFESAVVAKENFGSSAAVKFERIFGNHLKKQGSSATKRWAQNILLQLERIDKINRKTVEGQVKFLNELNQVFLKASKTNVKTLSKRAAINDEKVKKSLGGVATAFSNAKENIKK